MRSSGATASLAGQGGAPTLRVAFGDQGPYSGITLITPGWDLSGYVSLAMDVRNAGTVRTTVLAHLNGDGWIEGLAILDPGQSRTLQVHIKRESPPAYIQPLTAAPGPPGPPEGFHVAPLGGLAGPEPAGPIPGARGCRT